ncbi:MAG: hypothetical protein V7642_1269 [Burkholderiales bacterium]|jgi:hypothetical protein
MNEVLFLSGVIRMPGIENGSEYEDRNGGQCPRCPYNKDEQQVKQHNEYPFYA